jgi:NAD(P)-dependent dehydrogenase (short-subunit alcohol dehydrogenase family)
MQAEFTGKVIVVTGAGRGIGRAIAERFGRDGGVVVANDIGGHVQETADAIMQFGGQAFSLVADVSQKSEVDRLFDTTLERYGRLDVLVNNAGLVNESRHFLTGDEAWWDRVLATNLKSVFLCAHRAAWIMARADGGCIISMSSGGATRAHRGNVAYDASKGGIEAFTRAAALDLAPYRIRVNAVAPGSVRTGPLTDDQAQVRGQTIPLGRMAVSEDIANGVAFLASAQASYITGQTLAVDGGLLAQQRSPQVDIFPLDQYPQL